LDAAKLVKSTADHSRATIARQAIRYEKVLHSGISIQQPAWSSKPAGRGSPVGWFDSIAAPWL
jgi:hypothetical protein